MGLSCCDTMFKIILFIFNFVFFLCGIALIAIGSVEIAQEPDYNTIVGTDVYSIAILLIVVGCIITIVCFFGCFGAIKESKCMLYTYSALLAVIFCIELAGGIAALVYKDDLTSTAQTNMAASFGQIVCSGGDDQQTLENQWYNMQDDLSCCGANGPSDWFNKTTDSSCLTKYGPSYNLPPTCCIPPSTSCTQKDTIHYTQGCVQAASDSISDQAVIIGGVAIGLAVVELIGIILACCLARDVDKD